MRPIKKDVTTGVLLLAPLTLAVSGAMAQAVPGGTLDPLTIPKYVTPLVIPPVLLSDQGGTAPIDASVALRQFTQQVLPAPLPPTTLWGYCDGADTTNVTCSNPAFTIEVTKDTPTTVTWINGLVDVNGDYLPHIIQDAAGNPLVDQTLHWAAPNQDCLDGNTRTDCRGASADPYTGPVPMVTHVHGAHVGPISDGYPEAWWLPAANNIPAGYATQGTFYDDINGGAPGTGTAVYQYQNDQPTTTLWYHDHSLGITRLTVYAAGSGFWLIRDPSMVAPGCAAPAPAPGLACSAETGLIAGTLPGPAPALGDDPNGVPAVRATIREIPIAIQPKSFNVDGSQYYPADRAFFEGLGTGDTFALNTGLNIPFLPDGAGPNPAPPPPIEYTTTDISPVWNPEAFFNTMVVNGNTWPVLQVAPERYRFRMLNAADSRFLNLAMFEVKSNGGIFTNRERPFYQIGAEQSLLPQVVRVETGFATPLPGNGQDVCTTGNGKPKGKGKGKGNAACVPALPGIFAEQALLIGPAERADVVVDFTGLADGTRIRIVNTAPDAPFGGFPDVPADPATTGQVMEFVVNSGLSNPAGDPSTPAPSLVLDASPGGVPKLGPSTNTQDLALLEEESALLCVTIDAVTGVITLDPDPNSVPPTCDPVLGSLPFAPKAAVLGVEGSLGGTVQLWDDPITTNPPLDTVETWELWNWSADAHPIHLHLVKFEVLNRQLIGTPPVPTGTGVQPWEAGWKDTVIAYPGEVTRVKALFDIAGLYVWHCHILSHEDNEMMVPYCVGDPANCTPPVL